MAEDLGGVLREVSVLLQRLTQQNDAEAQYREEIRGQWNANREKRDEATGRLQSFGSLRANFKNPSEEMRSRMEESRVLAEKRREEDIQYRQKLLSEIERHNQLLETLITKLVAGTVDS